MSLDKQLICYCMRVTDETIIKSIKKGNISLSQIKKDTKACTGDRCKELNPSQKCCSGDIKALIKQNTKLNINSIFVANKPLFISSNNYMYHFKRKLHTKKIGFSGTLDPFATGTLIVGTGSYTKLFRFLNKSPKVYTATIWLGAESKSLDIENIISINRHKILDKQNIKSVLNSLIGDITYLPPKYSAKKIDGKRAYQMTRDNIDFKLKFIQSTIYSIDFLNYNHPFISFNIKVSEGSYIRSIAQIILEKLDSLGTLSYLKRLSEGKFIFNNEQRLDITDSLNLKTNIYNNHISNFINGKKLDISDFDIQEVGQYIIDFKDFFSIIEINDKKQVSYLLNRVEKC